MHVRRCHTRPMHALAVALLLAGCAAPVPSASTTPILAPSPSAQSTAGPEAPPCPALRADASATLDPAIVEAVEGDEGQVIAARVFGQLAAMYAGRRPADLCDTFTGTGLRSAFATDPELRAGFDGRPTIAGALELRSPGLGDLDTRSGPPSLEIDLVFDVVDLGGLPIERRALHVEVRFDGTRWLADAVQPPDAELALRAALPTPLPPGRECTRFHRDDPGTPFDDEAGATGRRWCDEDGTGRAIGSSQLGLLTRYPCEAGHAAILRIGRPIGLPYDGFDPHDYVRDPADEFLDLGWIAEPYDGRARLPADAASTGWTNGNITLWISQSEVERAVYLRRGRITERWPRAAEAWGVTDCN